MPALLSLPAGGCWRRRAIPAPAAGRRAPLLLLVVQTPPPPSPPPGLLPKPVYHTNFLLLAAPTLLLVTILSYSATSLGKTTGLRSTENMEENFPNPSLLRIRHQFLMVSRLQNDEPDDIIANVSRQGRSKRGL